MAATLAVCTKEKQHGVFPFLCAEGKPGAEIHSRLSAHYGISVLLKQNVYK
jgi:hypothetical protein